MSGILHIYSQGKSSYEIDALSPLDRIYTIFCQGTTAFNDLVDSFSELDAQSILKMYDDIRIEFIRSISNLFPPGIPDVNRIQNFEVVEFFRKGCLSSNFNSKKINELANDLNEALSSALQAVKYAIMQQNFVLQKNKININSFFPPDFLFKDKINFNVSVLKRDVLDLERIVKNALSAAEAALQGHLPDHDDFDPERVDLFKEDNSLERMPQDTPDDTNIISDQDRNLIIEEFMKRFSEA